MAVSSDLYGTKGAVFSISDEDPFLSHNIPFPALVKTCFVGADLHATRAAMAANNMGGPNVLMARIRSRRQKQARADLARDVDAGLMLPPPTRPVASGRHGKQAGVGKASGASKPSTSGQFTDLPAAQHGPSKPGQHVLVKVIGMNQNGHDITLDNFDEQRRRLLQLPTWFDEACLARLDIRTDPSVGRPGKRKRDGEPTSQREQHGRPGTAEKSPNPGVDPPQLAETKCVEPSVQATKAGNEAANQPPRTKRDTPADTQAPIEHKRLPLLSEQFQHPPFTAESIRGLFTRGLASRRRVEESSKAGTSYSHGN
ncbi:unnamed protein product [Jaminaea pallidilutea]